MTSIEPDAETADADDLPESSAPGEVTALEEMLQAILGEQVALRADFERLAGVIEPIVTRTYGDTLARVRALEQRILARQERPTVNRLAQLLVSAQRLTDGADVKAHVEESVLDILVGLGYEQFGEIGDPLDEHRHDVLNAQHADEPRVTLVHTRGLESFGDVIVRARVDIGREGSAPNAKAGELGDSE